MRDAPRAAARPEPAASLPEPLRTRLAPAGPAPGGRGWLPEEADTP